MDKYYYSKELGVYQGIQVGESIELTEEQFNQYNGKEVKYENGSLVEVQKTHEEIKEEYKTAYLAMFNTKLKDLDYDSIATVQSWVGDEVYGVEAQKILGWYKAIIKKNYEIIDMIKNNELSIPTKEEYLNMLPIYDEI